MNEIKRRKPYNTVAEYYEEVYHQKVAKISLNANFTCPNKDGRKGFGGCTYCSKLGSGDFAGDKNLSLKDQFDAIAKNITEKWPNAYYMPYFQANSNTYAPLVYLKQIFEKAISFYPEKTVGIAIATRPDCLNNEIITYLGELNKKTHVQIELGFQTSNEKTAKEINRCSNNLEFSVAVKALRKENLEIVVHIINGLPNETKEDMLNTITYLNQFDIQGIKIHSLLILKNTKMGEDYVKEPWPLLSLDQYVDITVEQIRLLNPKIIIHRLAADGKISDLIAPNWTIKKLIVMNEIDKKMRANNYIQGDKYKTAE